MSADEVPDSGHRPLPSVDIPLLKEHRQAIRGRQVAFLAFGGLALASGAAAFWYSANMNEAGPSEPSANSPQASAESTTERASDAGRVEELAQQETPEAPESEAAPAAAVQDEEPRGTILGGESRHMERRFGKARSFREALMRAGLSSEERAELETSLTTVMDFRRCHPEDRMVIERDADRSLSLFEYHGSATAYVQVTRDRRGALKAEEVQRPIERNRIKKGGVIRSSLGNAFARAGLGRSLVGTVIDVFSSRVSFTSDARTGDTFRIIVDEERVGGEFHDYGTVHAIEYVGQRTGTLRAYWYEPSRGEPDFYDDTGHAVHGGWLRTPTRYDRISSQFNLRRMHPILRRVVPHNGVDYGAGTGTPVWAAANGTVTFAGERGANGNLVSLRHQGGYETFYAHLSRIARGMVRGAEVRQRQVIGYVGSTGRSTGPHLHFGLKRNGRFMDPLAAINGPGRRMPAGALPQFRARVRRLVAELGRIDAGDAPRAALAQAAEPESVPEDVPMD